MRLIPKPAHWYDAPGMAMRAARGRPLAISYPKAGRTWLRVMLNELGIWPEFTHLEAGLRNNYRYDQLVANPLWCAGRPTLLLLRHPLDTLVSSFFQATKRLGIYQGTLAEFAREPRFGVEKIVAWNLLWAGRSARHRRFRVVEYEALHADARAVLAAAARFFGAEPSDAALTAALEAGRIDKMREKESRGEYQDYGKKLMPGDLSDPDSFKVRRGVVRGFTDYLDAGDIAFCEQVLERRAYWAGVRAALARSGLLGR